ncbi:hypothetical protein AB0J86_13745 [Micromonospora sp. NPDC049559]|uniref:hypothetical protein n=1 Tax=Micromonospora sp. NPDC049559 TaxID=3155923 RepID=UPI003445E852
MLACLAGRALLGGLAGDGTLTARSSCAEFLRAPSADQARAIEEVALAGGVSGLDARLAQPAVVHYCAGRPGARLGEVVAKLGG